MDMLEEELARDAVVRERQRVARRKNKLKMAYTSTIDNEVARTLERLRLLIEIQIETTPRPKAVRRLGRRAGISGEGAVR